MRKLIKLSLPGWIAALVVGALMHAACAAPAEWNPVRVHPVETGASADRLIVGFRATPANSVERAVRLRGTARSVTVRQAQTGSADLAGLVARTQISSRGARQLTPSMHLILLSKLLDGTEVSRALTRLRADAAVEFAEVDGRRYAHAVPNDPLFQPGATNTGQWFMLTPTTASPTSDWSATDALSAWSITTGSTGTVIADVDSGFRFDHPDLLRAGFGGRLLPGYDFVGEDLNPNTGAQLGTFLIANDGDGWDPDPTDPGDWISASDQTNTTLFPSSKCPAENSSWHGTRVAGVLGAITNNGVGVAGMTWNPYILPVRALGKCGGYDSDIITGMQWAAGLQVSGAPDNPYPADIINLSIGGTGSCPSSYATVINQLTAMGVLIVASAGNASGPVDSPGNCAGVLAVAGLRNVGTKVGYSSLGPEVGISAPAGNCVNASGACLRSIDTTVNEGSTAPGANGYTDQINPNLGTSFSAPIVSGVAALMRAVNANLTPAQLILRIKASASPFPPNTTAVPVCPAANSGGECACTTSECGAGMLNALSAVTAALNPIAAVKIPANITAGASATFDASGSVAACNRSIASYAWTASGGVTIQSGANSAQVQASWNGSAAGTLVLTVTDGSGALDKATVVFATSGVTTAAPATAGTSSTACPKPLNFSVSAPTLSVAFSPATVGTNTPTTLTLSLHNNNPFDLTQASITESLPAGVTVATAADLATDCTGANRSLSSSAGQISLGNANIPAQGSCTVTVQVQSAAAGSYTESIADKALSTGPAGSSSGAVSADLTVTAPRSGGGGGGGGSVDWLDIMLIAGVFLLARGQLVRRVYNRRDE